ncbi:MAG: hypothetical protein HFF72_13880 [Oscillospiraceae bacterium]|nr:hypothetical protein [Oscillospiraceae bacterium]
MTRISANRSSSAIRLPDAATGILVKGILTLHPAWRNASIGILGRNRILHILRLNRRLIFRRIHSASLAGQQGQTDQQGQGQCGEKLYQ